MESPVQCNTTLTSAHLHRRSLAFSQSGLRSLSEIFPKASSDEATVGFVLSNLPKKAGPILWVQDRLTRKEAGEPYLPGLAGKKLIRVDLSQPKDVLWAMEEGLKCTDLSGVIGEIWGDPPTLDFTATKRLAIRAERHQIPCWLIRRSASPDLSAARDRWRVASLPSLPNPDDPKSPGAQRWQVELFRSRFQKPGTWIVTYDRAADRVDFSAPVRDGAMAEDHGPERRFVAR